MQIMVSGQKTRREDKIITLGFLGSSKLANKTSPKRRLKRGLSNHVTRLGIEDFKVTILKGETFT